MSNRPNPLKLLAVCGLGMGTSLILSMTVEAVAERLDFPTEVSYSDLSAAKGQSADVIIGQAMHISELEGDAPITIVIEDFLDEEGLEKKLRAALTEKGWLP